MRLVGGAAYGEQENDPREQPRNVWNRRKEDLPQDSGTPSGVCDDFQVGTASSATVVPEAVMCEGPQLAVQGNQV